MRICPGFLLLAALSALPAQARPQSVGHDLENGFKDMLYVWTAPSRLQSGDLPELGGVLAVAGAMALLDRPLYAWLDNHPRSLPGILLAPFTSDKPLNMMGRTHFLAPAAALLYSAGWAFDNPRLRQAGMGCLSSNLATTLPRQLVTRIIGRRRPAHSADPFQFKLYFVRGTPWEMHSFPAGHAANIMSCVSFLSRRFDLSVAEPLLYLAALGVGWGRVLEGAHWPSDTFVGQIYGWSVGRGIAERYLRRMEPDHAEAKAGIGIMIRIAL